MSKIVIVVDMQNDFCKPDGALYNADAEKIIPAIAARISNVPENYVVFTQDTHNYSDRPYTLEKNKIPRHCQKHTAGQAVVDELVAVKPNAHFIEKETFQSIDLADRLARDIGLTNIDEIEVCGTCTDICVISNVLALRSALPNTVIKVNANLCAGLTPEKHEAALSVMESCLIEVIR